MPINLGSVLEKDLEPPPPPPQKCAKLKIYAKLHREVRLGGWKAPPLGRHASACATILRLRTLLYLGCVRYYTCVRHISACAIIL